MPDRFLQIASFGYRVRRFLVTRLLSAQRARQLIGSFLHSVQTFDIADSEL